MANQALIEDVVLVEGSDSEAEYALITRMLLQTRNTDYPPIWEKIPPVEDPGLCDPPGEPGWISW